MDIDSAEVSVRRELEAVAARLPGAGRLSLAAASLALAKRIDNSDTSTTALANANRELRENMERLWALAPEESQRSWLDELRDGLIDPGRTDSPEGQSDPEQAVGSGGRT